MGDIPDTPLFDRDRTLNRMRAEFLEMPGLRLTRTQAQRLWGLDEPTCLALLEVLLDVGFLHQTSNGAYARLTDGPVPFVRLRMAKVEIRPTVTPSSVRSG